MPITRTSTGIPRDSSGEAFNVTGTNAAESYTTVAGDRTINMLGGNDMVTLGPTWFDADGIGATVNLGQGNDRLNDIRLGASNHVNGGNGNDVIAIRPGRADYSSANGNAGDDVLRDLGGGDMGTVLRGGIGNDRLYAGRGDDAYTTEMVGGPGRDEFFLTDDYQSLSFVPGDAPTGIGKRDIAVGFEPGVDDIRISGVSTFVGDVSDTGGVQPGQVGFFSQGDDLVVVWKNGSRQVLELDGLAGQSLNTDDFLF